MNCKTYLAAGVASFTLALALAAPAHAQSTGSIDFDDSEEIVVTGTRANAGVEGVIAPDTSKAKQVLTQENLARNNPGQTVLDSINIIPGVNFTNNDAYGSSGGSLTIRGFSSDRISLTFDGVPLNDSGNYAIYSNQQLDPELIEQVNVNLGTTDVDSPTAAASGSTVNYRTIVPTDEYGAMLSASYGDFNFLRVFGKLETGAIGPFGTKAFISASKATNDNPFNNYGKVDKQQYNARVYQPIGNNGDFLSVAGNYNENRNNFFGSVPLRNDLPNPSGFPQNSDERRYKIDFPCLTSNAATAGVADTANNCGSEFDRRYNPSNTGNIRGASRFTFGNFTLTVDPSYQYVKANGGGTTVARERLNNGLSGYIGGRPYFGMDINGDGDLLDEVRVVTPSQTLTHRYGVIANLRYDFSDTQSIRLAYSLDHAKHRQTGQVGLLDGKGEPLDVFPVNDPLTDVTGSVLQKRDRLSYAILNQVAGEYRGEFGDALTVTAGLRLPFFKRELNNYCFTTSDSGFVDCFGNGDPRNAVYAGNNPNVQGPQQRVLRYNKALPNVGFVYKFNPTLSTFGNYSKGLQVPGTDNLYNSFFFAPDTGPAKPEAETTDNFDLGVRYTTPIVQAQLSAWYTKYQNRLAGAYDPVTDRTVYRNLGQVDKYGLDGYVSVRPIENIALYAFGSYLHSEIKDDVQSGTDAAGNPLFVQTAGKRESGAPEYTYGGTIRGYLGPIELGVTGKRTGGRYIYDNNQPIFGGTTAAPVKIFDAKTDAYWLVNLDARYSLESVGLEKTYFQLNVYNLFDETYVGSYSTGLVQGVSGSGSYSSPPFAQIGAPRTVSGTLVVGF